MQAPPAQFRPMNFADILNATFNLYASNFVLFAGIVAVIAIPEAILVGTLSVSSSFVLAILAFLLTTGASTAINGALAEAVAARYLGRPMTATGAYETLGLGTTLTLLAASFVAALITVIGFFLLFFPGVFVMVRLSVVAQAVVLERKGVSEAIARSWNLVAGNWWRVFGIVITVTLLVALLETLLGRIIAGLAGPVIGSGLATALVGILVQPISATAITLLYYDLRIRKEAAIELTA